MWTIKVSCVPLNQWLQESNNLDKTGDCSERVVSKKWPFSNCDNVDILQSKNNRENLCCVDVAEFLKKLYA